MKISSESSASFLSYRILHRNEVNEEANK